MSSAHIVPEACARIEAACAEIEKAFAGTGYIFPAHGIVCILAEARREAQWIDQEDTEAPLTLDAGL
jgi:hypothetical protein